MKPIIKYRGGKSAELVYFLEHVPEKCNTYIEPFVGGGALYFHLEPEHAIISDINKKLITFYTQLKNNYSELSSQLHELQLIYENNQREYELNKRVNNDKRIENKNEALYYGIRNLFNYPDGTYMEGAAYYFINKTSYSGMIRYNKKGEYNVPFGRYRNFNVSPITERHHDLLSRTSVYCTDYSSIFNLAAEEDFMFIDPPYECIFNDYGNLYQDNAFDEDEQKRLAQDFRNLSCMALMVINKTPLTMDLYKDYVVDEYHKSYMVNIRNRFKNEANHIIIKNFKK